MRKLWVVWLIVMSNLVLAQDNPAILAVRTDQSAMQTGEFYTIRIEVDAVNELWSAAMSLGYDPQTLYVVGTESGSPLSLGEPIANGSIIVQNSVDDEAGTITFTPSRIAPADPVSGNIVLGTFLVMPLQSGETQITFNHADLSRVLFTTNEEGQRVYKESEAIPFAVTTLNLSITGDPATPPPEETATPTPTATIDPDLLRSDVTEEATPTLIVVTDAAPLATPTVLSETQPAPVEEDSSVSTLLLIAIGMVVIALAGLIGLFFTAKRQNR